VARRLAARLQVSVVIGPRNRAGCELPREQVHNRGLPLLGYVMEGAAVEVIAWRANVANANVRGRSATRKERSGCVKLNRMRSNRLQFWTKSRHKKVIFGSL
jgi:hypothetical protein